jgi:hypothetical protein
MGEGANRPQKPARPEVFFLMRRILVDWARRIGRSVNVVFVVNSARLTETNIPDTFPSSSVQLSATFLPKVTSQF